MKMKTATRAGVIGLAITGLLAGCGLAIPGMARTYKQPGATMEPAIHEGDVINRAGVGTPHRGEVVFVKSEVNPNLQGGHGDMVIKRIVGLPGEKVSSIDGAVAINGRPLAEPYLAPGTRTEEVTPVTVPAGEYYLLGDNRGDSADSRYFGAVSRTEIVGSSNRIVRPSKHAGRIKGT
jgi:signal peptidase I